MRVRMILHRYAEVDDVRPAEGYPCRGPPRPVRHSVPELMVLAAEAGVAGLAAGENFESVEAFVAALRKVAQPTSKRHR